MIETTTDIVAAIWCKISTVVGAMTIQATIVLCQGRAHILQDLLEGGIGG